MQSEEELCEGNQFRIELSDSFQAKRIELIIMDADEEIKKYSDNELDEFQSQVSEFYSNYKVDLTNFKFNRDELNER